MGDKTSIEWTATVHPDGTVTPGATWNPVTGCQKISPGCKFCYAERVFPRAYAKQCICGHGLNLHLGDNPLRTESGNCREIGCQCYEFRARRFTDVLTHPDRLEQPLHWKKPRRIFVNSMSDLFHEDVPFEFVLKVFSIMAAVEWHQFQVLTKRPERMLQFVQQNRAKLSFHSDVWPIPNIWLGVSVENQQYADQRIPLLLQTPAAVRFVSYEPALGPVDFNTVPSDPLLDHAWIRLGCPTLDWVIVGGESGPGARPFNVQWARDVIQQCRTAGVACFVKQLGAQPWDGEVRLEEQIRDRKGGNMEEWEEDLRVREFPASRGGL